MTSPLDRQHNDLAVEFVPPSSETDPRVPTAEELTLNGEMLTHAIFKSRQQREWKVEPSITTAPPREVRFTNGQLLLPEHPDYLIDFSAAIVLPELAGGSGLIKQDSHITLLSMVLEVGADQDSVLGEMTFQYLSGDAPNQVLQTVEKENTRRHRAFWLLAVSNAPIVVSTFVSTLPVDASGDRIITVANNTQTGFALGAAYQVYTTAPEWSVGGTYRVIPDFVQAMPLCRVQRFQNYSSRGYTWGSNGEDDLDDRFTIIREPGKSNDLEAALRRRLLGELILGRPGPGLAYSRTVQNMVAGAVAGNPGRQGESASSPNGSTALANNQRIFFLNERRSQRIGVELVVAANNGTGLPEVSAPLNTQSPIGSVFSQNSGDHRIYTLDGREESNLGDFVNLGGTGTLTWRGSDNTTILPGQQVLFVPAIQYPAGSGFSVPFSEIESAWVNAAQISAENIREGGVDDIETYEDPVNGDDYFVVSAPERAGLLYIYRKYSVTSNSEGVAIAPAAAKGCFAFIEGLSGLIDRPVVTGLTPNTTYNALCYYTPRIDETWQLQLRYCSYQGLQDSAFLDGSEIISRPIGFINVQGGGNFIYQGDGVTQFVPISMHLPLSNGAKPYTMFSPVFLNSNDPDWWKEHEFSAGSGLSFPSLGQMITVESQQGVFARSIAARLLGDGIPLGFRSPVPSRDGLFQCVLAFLVRKDGITRMVVVTHIGRGGEAIEINAGTGTGVDVFAI